MKIDKMIQHHERSIAYLELIKDCEKRIQMHKEDYHNAAWWNDTGRTFHHRMYHRRKELKQWLVERFANYSTKYYQNIQLMQLLNQPTHETAN